MTKIKNTKKGMAKKTLSISLAVAMLATSNVPVWAAEFTDGTDAAFTSEAVVETPVEEVVTDAPVVEDEVAEVVASTVSNDSFNVAPVFTGVEDNAVTWGSKVGASFTVKAKDNATIPNNIKFYYAWRLNGKSATATEFAGTVNNAEFTPVATDAGKTLDLYIYAVDTNNSNETIWTYTSDSISIKAKNVAKIYDSISVNGSYTYDGKTKVLAAKDVTLKAGDNEATADKSEAGFKVVQTGDHKNATKEAKITLVPTADGYVGELSTTYEIAPMTLDGSSNKIADHMVATLKTTSFAYTGNVIRVKKDDVTLIDKDTKEDLSQYLYADENGYVSIEAGTAHSENQAIKAGDITNARLTLVIGQPTTGEHNNYKITAENTNGHRTIQTDNTLKVTTRDLSDVKVSIKSQTITTDGKKVTIDKDDIVFTDESGKVLNLFNDVDITVPDNAKEVGTYTATIKHKDTNKNVTGQTTADFRIVVADIAGGTFANVGDDNKLNVAKEYTGEQIVITKEDLGVLTIKGEPVSATSYELENGKNVNIKDGGYVIVKGLGSFEGSSTKVYFDITPAVVTEIKVTNDKVEKIDTKNAEDYKEAMGIVVKAKNANKPAKEFTLVEGTDYKVEFDDLENNEIGKQVNATIKLVDDGNFVNTKPVIAKVSSTITAKNLKSEYIKLKETNFTYTGKAIEPEFDVVIDGKVINPAHYTKSYTANLNAGTATLTVKGDGKNFSDKEASVTFTINPADVNSLEGVIASKEYKGYSIELEESDFNLTLNKERINVKDNFTLSYGRNVEIGEGTVTLTPKNGNFTGSRTFAFQITGDMLDGGGTWAFYDKNGIAVDENDLSKYFTYDGTAKEFAKSEFTYTGKDVAADKLVEGVDYEIKYVDNIYGKDVDYTGVQGQHIAVLAIAKGKYGSNFSNKWGLEKGVYTDAEGNKISNVISVKYIKLNQLNISASNVSVSNGTYAAGLPVKPVVDVIVKGVVLKEGQDYELKFDSNADLTNVTPSKSLNVKIVGKNGYTGTVSNQKWGIDKFNLANADVSVKDDKVIVKCGRVDIEASEYTVEKKDSQVTVTAVKDSKNYTGSKTIDAVTEKPAAPMIQKVNVVGNKATVVLSGDSEGATGYDYVISTDRDCITNKDYDAKRVNVLNTSADFTYTQQGTYYAYCHAWKRGEDGKKVFSDWSNAYPFVVSAITPSQPAITSVKVKGSTVTVTYTKSSNADGYDVVLGSKVATVAGEKRPVEYGTLVKKNIKGNTVTATFKNVKKGTYYAGLHAFNRTSEDGKKVFSPWSNVKRVTVK